MAKYILKRVLMALVTVFVVASLTFFLMKAVPGNPYIGEKIPPALRGGGHYRQVRPGQA